MDCSVWLVTFGGCLFISIDAGLGLGIGLGLLLLFVRTAFAHLSALARLPGTSAYRDSSLYGLQVTAAADSHFSAAAFCCVGSALKAALSPEGQAHLLPAGVALPHALRRHACAKGFAGPSSVGLCVLQDVAEGRGDEGVRILRLQGPLCFANAQHVKERLEAAAVRLSSPALPNLCAITCILLISYHEPIL